MGMFTFYNNFTAGEVGPRIYPRIDLVQRKNGAKRLQNALPTVHGGFIGRPGTSFVCRTKYANKTTRLIPFKYSISQSYVIEFGDLYMRFITNGGRLEESAKVITGAADSGTGLIRITSAAHGYSNGQFIAIRNILGTVEANGDWEISGVAANTFDLVGSVFSHAYTSGGTANKIIELASPYTEAQLNEVKFTPDADLLYFVHPDVTPKVLTRTSATTFTITDLVLIGGPFNDLNSDDTHTMTSSLATVGAGRTLTSSTAYFTASMVGHLFRMGGTTGTPAVQGYGQITGFTSTTVVTWTIIAALSAATATATWALGAFGPATGYPRAVTWFDQRLTFLGTDTQPQSGWMSGTARVLDFSVGTTADAAIAFTVRTDEVNDILWGVSSDALILGTTAGEHKVIGGQGDAITPTNIVARQQTAYGSKDVRPLKIGDIVVHVQRGGRRIRQVSFSFDKDRYISNDLSLLAYHLFEDVEVVDMSFQLQPDPIIWFVLDDGTMRSCTLLPDQNVAGFARHTFANGFVQQVVSLARNASQDDETYISVRRTVNGQTVKYIELFDLGVNTDSSLTGSFGTPVSSVDGLSHLEGQTVRIVADGSQYNDKTVTLGNVTISTGENTMSNVMIGLAFEPTCELLSPEWELQSGPTFGKKKFFNKVLIFTNDTMTLALNGDAAEARDASGLMDTAPAVDANGVFQFATTGNAEQLHLSITQPNSLPISVVGVYGECTMES